MHLRRALLPAALLLALVGLPAVAQADTVTCNAIPAIDDGLGGVWWAGGTLAAASAAAEPLGALEISVTNGASSSIDAYDIFGALFVGATKYDAAAGSCSRTVQNGTTTIRYPEVAAANGLQVRRSLTFLALNEGAGHVVHLVTQNNIVRNPTGSAIVSDITVGDPNATGTNGNLGSDSATTVIATSSGDTSTTTADNWAITADAAAGAAGSDPVLYHGWGQTYQGGDRPEEVGATNGVQVDDWHTKWSAVSVPAGATVSYQTLEAVALSDPKSVSQAAGDLQGAASSLTSAEAFFAGPSLTVPEIVGSRNVQTPQPSLDPPAPDFAAVGEPVQLILRAVNNSNVAQCAGLTQSLTYDGTQVLSANGRLTAAGVAGTHPYSATTTNGCGQTATRTGSVVVAGTTTSCDHSLFAGSGIPLFDGGGAAYDPAADGSFTDGGFLTPPNDDSYDGLGQLRVNGTAFDPSSSGGCALDAGGREIRTQTQNIGGLDVSRSTYVASGGPGGRMAVFLRNTTASPITVPVMVGSQFSLGSDSSTNIVATGNGTTTVTPAARWMVTDDDDGANDAALAHVWDGAGGADAADSVVLDDPTTPEVRKDDYEVTYNNVTVAPGATAGYVLWEGQRIRNPRAVGERDDAIATANTLAGLSGNDLYGGMTAAEVASVRNWVHPAPTGTLSGPASGAIGTAQTFTVSGLSGGAGVPACGAGAVAWTVDGATVPGASSLTTSFATVGTHTVTATISGDCAGGTLVRTASFAAGPATTTPPPVATVKITGLKVIGGCLTAPKRKVTIKASATVAVATKATLKIQKLVGKAKTCVKSTSAAGKKLLKTKGAKTVFTKNGKVVKGKVSFTVKARTVKTGKAKVVKGVLVLPRGAYRLVISSGTKATATLVIVK